MNKKISILAYAIILGVAIYIMDSVIFFFEFTEKYSFLQALFTKVPFWELLNRLLTITIVFIAGLLLYEQQKDTESGNRFGKSKTLQIPKGQLNFNFLSSLAFQIRTPLNAIIGFSELLKMPNLTPESREIYINHVNSSSKYLLLLINNLSEISKIDSDELTIKKSECDITEILKDIFPVFQARKIELSKPEISLIIETPKQNEKTSILTDPERLKQVLYNLIENAIINSEKGLIKLSYSINQEGYIEFSIKDNGRGFSQERLESIFERYNKLTDNKNMPFDGSVLRLAISKSLVKILGGEIRADSVIGQGTTIFFTIPNLKVVPKPKEVKNVLMNDSPGSINWSDRLILISEDVYSNYLYLSELLKPTKISILWAKNGIEAVDFVMKNPKIELVLMDILMPEMDGYQASKEIKNIRKDLPIIAQTACSIEGGESNGLNTNFDSYLTKPIWQPQLMSAINKYIY